MANNKSSKKRILISRKRNKINISKKNMIKTFMKKIKFYVNLKNKNLAFKNYIILQSIIDKFSCKKIIHKNKSARLKSNLMKLINKI